MKHRKSSQRQVAKRREGKQHAPRVTHFPLPPTIHLPSVAVYPWNYRGMTVYVSVGHIWFRTTCMMERERWA